MFADQFHKMPKDLHNGLDIDPTNLIILIFPIISQLITYID